MNPNAPSFPALAFRRDVGPNAVPGRERLALFFNAEEFATCTDWELRYGERLGMELAELAGGVRGSVPKVWLKAGRDKSLRRRHPWVFSGAIERLEGDAAAGATVDIVGSSGEVIARGAYSPTSQIRVRVWSFEPTESIDAAFLRRRLARAIESRRRLELLDREAACRLVFSESDGMPGLIVDRYGEWALMEPRKSGVALAVWVAPLILLAIGLLVVLGSFKKPAAQTTVEAPADDFLEQVRKDLEK